MIRLDRILSSEYNGKGLDILTHVHQIRNRNTASEHLQKRSYQLTILCNSAVISFTSVLQRDSSIAEYLQFVKLN